MTLSFIDQGLVRIIPCPFSSSDYDIPVKALKDLNEKFTFMLVLEATDLVLERSACKTLLAHYCWASFDDGMPAAMRHAREKAYKSTHDSER